MCRRFALDLDWDAVASQFAVDEDDVRVDTLPQPSYNIAPMQNIGVVAQGKDGRRHLTGALLVAGAAMERQQSAELPHI